MVPRELDTGSGRGYNPLVTVDLDNRGGYLSIIDLNRSCPIMEFHRGG